VWACRRAGSTLPLHCGICICATGLEQMSQLISETARRMFGEIHLWQYVLDDMIIVVVQSSSCQAKVVACPYCSTNAGSHSTNARRKESTVSTHQ
jgi:hypothetical protein